MLKVAAADRKDVLIGRDLLQYCRFTYDGRVGGMSLYEQSYFGVIFSRLHFKTLRLRDALINVMRRR
jgi:hypothetical protein